MTDPLPTPHRASAAPLMPFEALSQSARSAAFEALAPSTRVSYRNGLKRIQKQIRKNLNLSDADPVPMNDHTISDAIEAMHNAGQKASTLSLYLSAIRFAADIADIPDPVGASCDIVMRAIRRRAPAQRQVTPFIWEQVDLAVALSARETGPDGRLTLAGQRDAAILATMSDALLRVSEVSALRIPDFKMSADESATLLIRQHKTSKGEMSGGDALYLGVPTAARVNAWLEAAGLDPDQDKGPLFRRLHKNNNAPRCGLCDGGYEGCCRHNAPPHPCCRHRRTRRTCVPGQCCVHSSRPHICCVHEIGDHACTGTPCCRHLGGCEECRCPSCITPESVRIMIKARAAEVGLSSGVSGHSLRVGSAISLVRANAEVPALMQAGRWASAQTVHRYIRREEAARGAVAKLRYHAA